MSVNEVTDILQEGIFVVLKMGGPMLVLSMIVGVLISVFQAVTQIHEQTLSFGFKLVVIVGYMFVFGGWMMRSLVEYTEKIFLVIQGGG